MPRKVHQLVLIKSVFWTFQVLASDQLVVLITPTEINAAGADVTMPAANLVDASYTALRDLMADLALHDITDSGVLYHVTREEASDLISAVLNSEYAHQASLDDGRTLFTTTNKQWKGNCILELKASLRHYI
jgi:hypothetical protein